MNTGYLEDSGLVELTDRRTVPVGPYVNVVGYRNIYAAGDIAGLPDAKTATHAQTQAQVVVDNLRSQREFAYNRDPVLGSGTGQISAAAADRDWTLIDMAADWSVIYPPVPGHGDL